MAIRPTLLLLLAGAVAAFSSGAQTIAPAAASASKPLVFEVASIRPSKTQQYNGVDFTPDGARAVGISLQNLIRSAYNERHDELWSGGNSWMASEYYDLSARFDPAQFKDINDAQRRVMLQALLADRFKLVVRRETRILPHFALTIAKGGPKMQETKAENIKADDENKTYCRAGLSNFRQCTMAEFANVVSYFGINSIVDDHTGLKGRYDFTLAWSPQSPAAASPDAPPDIFTAVQDQLGLKLEPIKGPVDTFAIEHVERPTEN
jgi:uncharacterized protein (TIGR03435 family)